VGERTTAGPIVCESERQHSPPAANLHGPHCSLSLARSQSCIRAARDRVDVQAASVLPLDSPPLPLPRCFPMVLLKLLRLAFLASAAFSQVQASSVLQRLESAVEQAGGSGEAATAAVPASKFTYPTTAALTLRRSDGGNTKDRAKAAAGHPGYQRLMRAQEHGARINAERRAEYLMATGNASQPVGHTTFIGCPFADMLVPTIVGSSLLNLIIDTGSSSLAAAGAACSNCQGVPNTWQQTATATLVPGAQPSGLYGDGSGWQGKVYKDRVAFATQGGAPVTPYQPDVRVVIITSQSTQGRDAAGNADPSATPFFTKNPCNDATKEEQDKIFSDGIVGIAFQELASDNTDSAMALLLEQYPTSQQSFALRLCQAGGDMWIGGADSSAYKDAPIYTPVTTQTYYTVEPEDVFVNGQSLGYQASDWPTSGGRSYIIDSGTTLWELPPGIYDSIVEAITADAGFTKYFDSSFFTDSDGYCTTANGVSVSTEDLQSSLPTISISFKSGLILSMDGLGSYMQPCSNDYSQFTPGITRGTSQDGMIAGWSFMNQ
jgi:hypothetical protein